MNISEYVALKNKPDKDALDLEILDDYENHIMMNAWIEFCNHLPEEPVSEYGYKRPVWCDGEIILCESENLAETVADMFELITGECDCHTGYYDPEEDERNNEVNDHTGWYYVDFD